MKKSVPVFAILLIFLIFLSGGEVCADDSGSAKGKGWCSLNYYTMSPNPQRLYGMGLIGGKKKNKAKFSFKVKFDKKGTLKAKFKYSYKSKIEGINFKFKSTSIDYFDISDNTVLLQGWGKLGKIDGYYFELTADDEGPPGSEEDDIEVYIWDRHPDDPDAELVHDFWGWLDGGDIKITE